MGALVPDHLVAKAVQGDGLGELRALVGVEYAGPAVACKLLFDAD